MTALRFVACDGLVTVDVEIDTENFLEWEKPTRDGVFLVVDQLHEMFDDFVDPAVKAPRKKRATPVKRAKKQTPPPAPEADRPKIGDTRPAPDPREITKRLKGDGKIRWEDQIALLFNGTCDRIVREVVDQKAGNNLKYFIQNKDRRVRVDVSTFAGGTVVEVRRREGDE